MVAVMAMKQRREHSMRATRVGHWLVVGACCLGAGAATSQEAGASWSQEVAAARTSHPGAFAAIEKLRTATAAHPPSRERRANLARKLQALGPDALLPMLALLDGQDAVPGKPGALAAMSKPARLAFTLGMLEALKKLKDGHTAPVMQRLLEGQEDNAEIANVAAENLGMLARDGDVAFLAAHAVAGDRRDVAAITGLGFARTAAASNVLTQRLAAETQDSPVVETLARALGWQGSSWAWTAAGPARAEEGLALRTANHQALAAAYVAHKGAARTALGHALLMVEHPDSPALLATLSQGKDAALARDVAALQKRFPKH